MAHTDRRGNIFIVNGELLDSQPVPSEPILEPQEAIYLASKEAGISPRSQRPKLLRKTDEENDDEENDNQVELAMVRDANDNVCFAWKVMVEYTEVNEEGGRLDKLALLYADTQTGRLW